MAKEKSIGAGEFKAHCLNLIDEVYQSRQSIVITKHGKPLAKLIPFTQATQSLFGCLEGSVDIHGDIIESTGESWNADQ